MLYQPDSNSSNGPVQGGRPISRELAWNEVIKSLHCIMPSVHVTIEDCGICSGISLPDKMHHPYNYMRSFYERSCGRRICYADIAKDFEQDFEFNTPIGAKQTKILFEKKIQPKSLKVRSPSTCNAPDGVCAACYGLNPLTGAPEEIGSPVGTAALYSIENPTKGKLYIMPSFILGENSPVLVLSRSSGKIHYGELQEGTELLPGKNQFSNNREPLLRFIDKTFSGKTFLLSIQGTEDSYKLASEDQILVFDGEVVEPGTPLFQKRSTSAPSYRLSPLDYNNAANILENRQHSSQAVLCPFDGIAKVEKSENGGSNNGGKQLGH